MRRISKYLADDGTEFKDPAKCRDHEKLLCRLTRIEAIIGPRPKDIKYLNGHGYLAHSPKNLKRFKAALYAEALPFISHLPLIGPSNVDLICSIGIVGRWICDCCPQPIYDLWYRLMCLDDRNREWGQPYFAFKPLAGEEFEIEVAA